jgi:hypothetical protein
MTKKMIFVRGFVAILAMLVLAGLIFWWTQRLPSVNKVMPPSSATLYDTLDTLWTNRKYAQVKSFLDQVDLIWKDYIPVRISVAVSKYYFGGQVEDTVNELEKIKADLSAFPFMFSPMFLDTLESRTGQYKSVVSAYQRHGVSVEERKKKQNPLYKSNFKHAKRWGDDVFFFNAPEALITKDGVTWLPLVPDESISKSSWAKMKEEQLLKFITATHTPILDRKAAVKELVSRRLASGKMEELLKGLYEPEGLYTYHATADQVVKKGTEAIPALLDCLNTRNKIFTDRRKIIWPLVRIGDTRPEVIQALEKVRDENPPSLKDSPYAKQAIEYLKRNQEKAP